MLGVLLPIGLFILLPTFITGLFRGVITSGLLKNIVEGLMKIVIFVTYLVLISKMKEMRRVFEYHGAEHKSIACYEAGLELTPENAAACRKEHPRCGTSLLFMVLIISIILSSFISWSNILIRMSLRILLIPVVVAVSYEISKYIGKNDNIFTRFLRAPGLWLQKLTTQEPDEGMLEVAITALKLVIPEEEGLDKW